MRRAPAHAHSIWRPCTKLDEQKVMVILRSELSTAELAELYDVTQQAVRDVRNQRTWTEVSR